jgi:hypothetical protein
VWHKEILWALDQGIAVYGSSSMGALRAAECQAFGMRGIGRIFEDYASGKLTADDEVALAHADATHDWRALSEALVNVRATLAAAIASGIISESTAGFVIAAGQGLYFPDRTWPWILAAAGELQRSADALASGELAQLADFVRSGAVDQKHLDAVELLEHVAGLAAITAADPTVDTGPASEQSWPFNNSRPFRGLIARDRRVTREPGTVSVEQIFRHLMLHRASADDLLRQASLAELGMVFAEVLGIEATAEQTADEAARFRRRRGLTDDEPFTAYLRRNDLRLVDFSALMTRQATLRTLVDWLRLRRYRIGLADPVLTELRLRDEYAPWADRAARNESLLAAGAEPTELEPLADLVTDQLRHTAWRPGCNVGKWADEADFSDVYQLHSELNRAAAARRALLNLAGDQALRDLLGAID